MKSPSSVSPSQALGASIRLGLAVGDHRPRDYYEQNATLREVIDFIASGALGSGDTELFRPIVENLSITIPSYGSPITRPTSMRRDRVSALWCDPHAWTRQSILNSARMGKFSSDRSIREYCEYVWRVQHGPVNYTRPLLKEIH